MIGGKIVTCPACKSDRSVAAREWVPRIEEGFNICIDCGCVFVLFDEEWKRQALHDIWASIKVRKQRAALAAEPKAES